MVFNKNPYESRFDDFETMPLIPWCDKYSSVSSVDIELPMATGCEFSVASISSNSSCPAIQSLSRPFLIPNP